MITNFLYLFTFYLLSQLVKIKTWELRPILELSPILELKPPSDVEIFIKARALITVNTVDYIDGPSTVTSESYESITLTARPSDMSHKSYFHQFL